MPFPPPFNLLVKFRSLSHHHSKQRSVHSPFNHLFIQFMLVTVLWTSSPFRTEQCVCAPFFGLSHYFKKSPLLKTVLCICFNFRKVHKFKPLSHDNTVIDTEQFSGTARPLPVDYSQSVVIFFNQRTMYRATSGLFHTCLGRAKRALVKMWNNPYIFFWYQQMIFLNIRNSNLWYQKIIYDIKYLIHVSENTSKALKQRIIP